MSRQIKLQTREMGDLHLMLVRSKAGVWEPAWEPLRTSKYAEYLTVVSKETIDHALHGWTSPLIKSLGPEPKLILHRISPDSKQCTLWDKCIFYRKTNCLPKSPKMPHCFELPGVPVESGQEVLRLWRESVYVVVVEEE